MRGARWSGADRHRVHRYLLRPTPPASVGSTMVAGRSEGAPAEAQPRVGMSRPHRPAASAVAVAHVRAPGANNVAAFAKAAAVLKTAIAAQRWTAQDRAACFEARRGVTREQHRELMLRLTPCHQRTEAAVHPFERLTLSRVARPRASSVRRHPRAAHEAGHGGYGVASERLRAPRSLRDSFDRCRRGSRGGRPYRCRAAGTRWTLSTARWCATWRSTREA